MISIGIFGGTFNPIHIGHIKMAKAALKQFKLEKIYFIPCGIPPHKSPKKMLPAKLRYRLIKDALKKNKHFEVLDIEIKKKKECYTVDTIKKLKSNPKFQTSRFYFLIGQDEFEKLYTWKGAKELVKLVTFIVLPRKIKRKKVKAKHYLLKTKPIDISSTDIRKKSSFNA